MRLKPLFRVKVQRQPIDAVAFAGGFGAVAENMPQMPAAGCAMHLCPRISDLVIGRCADGLAADRRPETGPSGAAVIFGSG